MTPERIAQLTESETKSLYKWAMGVLGKLLHLDPEKKCEIANEAMKGFGCLQIPAQEVPNSLSATTSKPTYWSCALAWLNQQT